MSQASATRASNDLARWLVLAVLLLVGVAASATYGYWSPPLRNWLARNAPPADEHAAEHGKDEHGHEHGSDENTIELTEQARRSIGLKTGEVALTDFERTIAVPGMVVERPGRSRVEITAPLTGIVTKILTNAGEAVTPGQELFQMRLTHEELVQMQADLLRTAEELDVIRREVTRLEKATETGALAGKTLLDRQYELQKQEAVLRAQSQALMLHGLSEEQVGGILKTRTLLAMLSVRVPGLEDEGMQLDPSRVLQVQDLRAELGKHVTAGDVLAELADHTDLLIEGEAFEQDASNVTKVVESDQAVSAVLDAANAPDIKLPGLKILYLANRVDPASRALHFYVALPNRLLRDSGKAAMPRYVDWTFKPGQRMQLRLPVEHWQKRIVLPVEAVAQDGVESYVFRANGQRFERQAVQVEYRDPQNAVIANDGSLFPGEKIAISAAQQLQLAIKNKAGGGIDPHAGHSH